MSGTENPAALPAPNGAGMPGMKIGVGVAYYGGIDPMHRAGIVECQEADIPIMWLVGGAYPEMNYAEIFRDALASDLDALVIVSATAVFTLEAVKEAARRVAGAPRLWTKSPKQPFDFAAISKEALVLLAESETRTYNNTAILDTGFSNEKSRPFASPWAPCSDGSVRVEPLIPGKYLSPEEALLERIRRAGIDMSIASLYGADLRAPSPIFLRAHYGDPEERAAADIKQNYAFCVPTFGALDHTQQDALYRLQKAGCVILEYRNCPYIDQARSELARVAIEELGCDGVFFIDHDIIFLPIDAIKLCEEAEKKQDVVAAVYCMRKTAHSLIGAPLIEPGGVLTFFEGGGLVPALYSGLGFAAIPKCVFESLNRVLPPLYSKTTDSTIRPYFALDVNGSFYSGEDASFCARVQGLSIKMIAGSANPNGVDWDVKEAPDKALTRHKVWLDTRVRIFHKGSYEYGIEDHGVAVPRYATLRAPAVASRSECSLVQADNLSLQAQQRAQGLDDEASKAGGHAVLLKRGPCLNCKKPFEEHELVEGTERMGWVRICPEVDDEDADLFASSRFYVELIHQEHRPGHHSAPRDSEKERKCPSSQQAPEDAKSSNSPPNASPPS